MKDLYGIILVDGSEIILRIYQTENNQWQMIYTSTQDLVNKKREKLLTAYDIAEAIADLFSTTYTQKVIEWRICARFQPQEMIGEIAKATGLRVEYLDRTREQELLSKGMFTEFW
ncbi:MAG TPA: hypothetical protein VLF20_02615 [Patescibacteria group bacterium]|nr:hypothetical protein [Patescibacteria group bacterium]